ncbi:MAG TPA: HAMP domain-containing sensor histidine kinase [Kofleriaceae bacterium]|nr:HAMP domain-containing sensor histidine kinase [Kofleriaceae bacterium]
MPPSRVTPLAGWSVVAAFVLIGAALIATVWSTRSSISDASVAVRRGQALAIEQAVRADLADLDAVPSPADLQSILAAHFAEGLRYIAMIETRGEIAAAAGTPVSTSVEELPSSARRLREVDGRVRLTLRAFRRMKAGGRTPRYLLEIEPIQANELRSASWRTLGIGVVAALSLLGVAIVLVRRESRRHADERARERERRLASLGEMSAVLAHEIKNPLASLKGNAQLLSQMLAKALPEGDKPRAKAERVVDEAVRLEQLTNDLLHFVRTGAIQRTPVDPGAIVREAATSIPGDVTVDTAAAPAEWSLDAGRIREVIINLVDNAVAAGPPVTVSVAREGKRLVIEVVDHGTGVPEPERDKIFEPFFTGKTQGTGLGLAVARRVVELHGGTLAVLSSPRGGAVFRAEIPES